MGIIMRKGITYGGGGGSLNKVLLGELNLNSTNLTAVTDQTDTFQYGGEVQAIIVSVLSKIKEGNDIVVLEIAFPDGNLDKQILMGTVIMQGEISGVGFDSSSGSMQFYNNGIIYTSDFFSMIFNGIANGTILFSFNIKIYALAGGSGGSADWNINDENASGYIKNRPFYDGGGSYLKPILNSCEVTIPEGLTSIPIANIDTPIGVGQQIYVTYNGIEYVCIARPYYYTTSEVLIIGNGTINGSGDGNPGNNEPFYIIYSSGMLFLGNAPGTYTISIASYEDTLLNTTVEISGSYGYFDEIDIEEGTEYIVNLAGQRYVLLGMYYAKYDTTYLGNPVAFEGGEDNGIPFCIISETMYALLEDGIYPVSILTEARDIHKIDKKFLPDFVMNNFNDIYESMGYLYDMIQANRLTDAREVSF